MPDINLTKKRGRFAGIVYLLLAITGVISLLYMPSTYLSAGDAAATTANIASSQLVFRLGILNSLVSQALFVLLAIALYRLLHKIGPILSLLMAALVIVSASTGVFITLDLMAALSFASDAEFLAVFNRDQLDALSYSFVHQHSQSLQAVQIFWGLWLFPFAVLVIRSPFVPSLLGILLIVAGVGYVVSSLTFLVLPQHKSAIAPLVSILEIGELPMIFWLLIVGAKAPSLQEQGHLKSEA